MRRQPDLSFAAALRILDRHEPGLVDKLDKALGFTLLTAGTVAGLASLGTPIAPLGLCALVWGWVDQKNEACSLLRGVLKPARFKSPRGRERRELLEAAHGALVVSSFLDVFRESLATRATKDLMRQEHAKAAFEAIYLAELPTPSSQSFQENLSAVSVWAGIASEKADRLLNGVVPRELLSQVISRYESRFLELAADVSEFAVWASLGEHAATRRVVEAQGEALSRLEVLLRSNDDTELDQDLRALRRSNQGILSEPVIAADAEKYGVDVTFPTVERGFIAPHYKVARYLLQSANVASERWWDDQGRHADLDLMLTAYFNSPEAIRLPLLVLGHPGAGKSLLTKVIAARLPDSDYTVIRVPLRNVEATAPIIDQVQQALDRSTHRRTSWSRMAQQSADTIRVILLDGLDELLQASHIDRRGYLQEAMEFQRGERNQEQPVAIIVTSRTLVADRVTIPDGTTVVKLTDFNRAQIRDWVTRRNTANNRAITERAIPSLNPADLTDLHELAAQPLLLLMLALYAADPESPKLGADTSTITLYERLIDNFTRREVLKSDRPSDLKSAVEKQVERLSIAALGMFNRGIQYISDVELSDDIKALHNEPNAGRQLLGRFFFVHSAEAVLHEREISYEFLHASFGEYLAALHRR
ncbi:NACHT domain-containing protein [Actinokineospora inagensis]|uniref:NACHT domain-containing protein n=1 Tax=Actinokineospora inagensis TaxID=103730 RepID=UPI00041EFBCB|nr:AAA family ATPase [Actinokineospora inagensis]